MFRAKTLFVVGAGASAELGLPIGTALKENISKRLEIRFGDANRSPVGDQTIFDAYQVLARENRVEPERYRQAGLKLAQAMPLAISIDNFLEGHAGNQFIEASGKLAIVRAILDAERKSALYAEHPNEFKIGNTTLQQAWHVVLVQKLTEGINKSDVEKLFANVGFVIFNYDRCVEKFLHGALQVYYDISASTIESILRDVPFVHPYGTVGPLPWQTDGDKGIAYGFRSDDPNRAIASAKGIRVFSERVEPDESRARIQNMVAEAETLVFLGFSFIEQNMQLMSLENPGSLERVYGTALGISLSDQDVVEAQIRAAYRLLSEDFPVPIRLERLTCADFLRDYSRSITQPSAAASARGFLDEP